MLSAQPLRVSKDALEIFLEACTGTSCPSTLSIQLVSFQHGLLVTPVQVLKTWTPPTAIRLDCRNFVLYRSYSALNVPQLLRAIGIRRTTSAPLLGNCLQLLP
jgi:hypothetical protein